MADDWRIRIRVGETHADGLIDRLGADLGEEARRIAEDLAGKKLAVSRDGEEIFVYASAAADAQAAHDVIDAELRSLGATAHASEVEHWLEDEERWDNEPKGETWEEEEMDHGFAPWEVRVQCNTRKAAETLAQSLESEGYNPVRRFTFVIVGTTTREDAEALAERLHGEVEAGGDVVSEVTPSNPFAIFGGLGT
jgi:hypothetical protein